MLLRNQLACKWSEVRMIISTPSPGLKRFPSPCCPLDWGYIFPTLVISRTITMMHCIKHSQSGFASCRQYTEHIGNTMIRFCDAFQSVPNLATFRDEIVVGVNHQ